MECQTLYLDGKMSIIVGPNGGGKTNLLDALVSTVRDQMISHYILQQHNSGRGIEWELQRPGNRHLYVLPKHDLSLDKTQTITIELEASETDVANIVKIVETYTEIESKSGKTFRTSPWHEVPSWKTSDITPGKRITYKIIDGELDVEDLPAVERTFLSYLRLFEIDREIRNDIGAESLQPPLLYLPVGRSNGGFQARVQLSEFDARGTKQSTDAITSRHTPSLAQLAVGRLATSLRVLQGDDQGQTSARFYELPSVRDLTRQLSALGYGWELRCTNIMTNEFNVFITKQGTSFSVDDASSGEKELLTYIFAIYALNVRNAVIIVDEPELHLHPRWQRIMYDMFLRMSDETGNQFILATHSPTFITSESICHVSRVWSEKQRSRVLRLAGDLPQSNHLLSIINAQNNERIFFCDAVFLVEGISDRLFYSKVFETINTIEGHKITGKVMEVIDVGGKGFFAPYCQVLAACGIPHAIAADRDYLQEVGSGDVKALFSVNNRDIKKRVFEDIRSLDADTFVSTVESAMQSGDWANARRVWDYIKFRRAKPVDNLDAGGRATINRFIEAKYEEQVFILKEGDLESYLPEGVQSKDVDTLISFLDRSDYWDALPKPQRDEIEIIARRALQWAGILAP